MKLLLLLIFLIPFNVDAKEKVTLEKCVDGDTAWFKLDGETIKTRFLAIDTPESTKEVEEFGKEAATYTCNELKNAKKIQIEYDENSDKTDKYDRHLVWVFVDNELLQKKIIENGLAEVAYLYDDYKYTDILKESESLAKSNQLGIWGEYEDYTYIYLIIAIIIIVILCIFSETFRKKTIKKLKKKTKKIIDNL